MSKPPRALQELMTAVDAGDAVDVYVDDSSSASSDRRKLLGPRHRRSTYYGRGGAGARKSAPAVAAVAVAVAVAAEASSDASFEFSTGVNSYSSASPASMVFSDGQLRAHHFPVVSVSTGSSQSTSPLRSPSVGSSYSSTKQHSSSQSTSPLRSPSVGSSYGGNKQQQAGMTAGSKKRVTFATDGAADKAAVVGKAGGGGQQGKKSGGLLGCMASACGLSSRGGAVEPVARNDNRKVVAF